VTAEDGSPRRIRDAGDSAFVLELESRIDAHVNARVIAIAREIREAALPGVRDVASTYRSVAVFFDPLQTRLDAVIAALETASGHDVADAPARVVEVPVSYGGEHGPDLPDLAAYAGLPESEVIRRHAEAIYRVFMLGFVPGFAYMGIVDETIAAPRRATPRMRVPALSVAIAGRQTGIYPQETPGGWQIIGRTPLKPFDASRTPAVIFDPGDSVRFMPVSASVLPPEQDGRVVKTTDREPVGPHLTVIRPGLLTTIQDSGRWGQQDRGVPVAGPMDPVSHRIANAIVGNPSDAATLEITLFGPELRFSHRTIVAVAGADLSCSVDGVAVPLQRATAVAAGSTLRFGERKAGARSYLACAGGVALPKVLGSRATHVLSRMGGVEGRPVAGGDRIPLGTHIGAPILRPIAPTPLPAGGAKVRVLPGPQDDFFDETAFGALQSARFTISTQSNRMAYRLTGPPLRRSTDREMISDSTFLGAIQVPPSGDPILLMADRQTSGGYPQIATVISADIPLAAQLAPGDWIEFTVCTRREALTALLAQEGRLLALR
jgi:KipI family sensor histidine kinase inhibitor